jgi:hypothetical protein
MRECHDYHSRCRPNFEGILDIDARHVRRDREETGARAYRERREEKDKDEMEFLSERWDVCYAQE